MLRQRTSICPPAVDVREDAADGWVGGGAPGVSSCAGTCPASSAVAGRWLGEDVVVRGAVGEGVGGTLVASDGAAVLRGLAEGAGTGVPAAMVGYRSGLAGIEVSARGAAVSADVPSVGLREGRGAAVPVSGGEVAGRVDGSTDGALGERALGVVARAVWVAEAVAVRVGTVWRQGS